MGIGGRTGNPVVDFFGGIFDNLGGGGVGGPQPAPEPEPVVEPQTKQLPGYTSPAGQVSLFGQMKPDELAKWNEQQGNTPQQTSQPSGGLWGRR